tara:strand:- start:2710 stop:3273 length:564 start_codon:yes stop_codon:yes gene_type:complete
MNRDQSDLLLFEAVALGDEAAFELLFKLYYSPLCRYVQNMVSDHMQAQELVSDLFLKVWTKRADIHIHSTVRGYFYLAARNMAINQLKQKKQESLSLQEANLQLEAIQENPLEILISEEVIQEWESRINQLPAQRQKIFRMNKLEGKRHEEIAEELSLSVKTVRNHVQLALRSLSTLSAYLIGCFFP